MADRVRTFRNGRCRILRVSEGRWHAGWTRHLAQDEVRVRLKSFATFAPDDEVVGECYGDGTFVRFMGRVMAQSGQEIGVQVVGSLGFQTSQESIRIYAEGLTGILHTDEGDFDFLVTDVSPSSLGGLTYAFPSIGTAHAFTLTSTSETIKFQVFVANSRLDPIEAGCCRVGLKIAELGRLDAARWARVIHNMTQM